MDVPTQRETVFSRSAFERSLDRGSEAIRTAFVGIEGEQPIGARLFEGPVLLGDVTGPVVMQDRGATVLFSTHVMVHAEEICDHIIMIDEGRKVLDDTLAGIRHLYDPRSIAFEPLDPQADLAPLERIAGLGRVETNGAATEIHLDDGADIGQTMSALASAIPAARVEVIRPTLEDVFIKIVGRHRAANLEVTAQESDL